jgi:PilZ domain
MEFSMISMLLNVFRKKEPKEPRKEDRVRQTLPVRVYADEAVGVTRDLSFSGVYFEIDSRYQAGSAIKMTIIFDSPQEMQLECEGTVVRVDDHGSKMGVAVRINTHRLEIAHSPENLVNQDFDALESRERKLNLNERPSGGVVRCANPQSPKFGQTVGKCEFSTHNACDQVQPLDKGFGCEFALLNVPPEVPLTGNV